MGCLRNDEIMSTESGSLNNAPHRIAIVTGASSGIGEAICRLLVSTGYSVVGNARSGDKLTALADELGDGFCPVVGDACEDSTVEGMFEMARIHFGGDADCVVVNAGRGLGGPVSEIDLGTFTEIQELNVTGALALMQKAATLMVPVQEKQFPERAADIIVIGSVVGRHVSPFSAAYGATKQAIHSLTEALRREIGPKGVRVSLVEPGFVLSGFQDEAGYSEEMVAEIKEKFSPSLYGDDIAQVIDFILSRPPHVHVGDIVVRPTRQDYP